MSTDPDNAKTQVLNQQRKSWMMNLKYILDKSKQYIDVKKYENPTGTLDTTFLKPVVGVNPFVRFGYDPQTICNHTQGQVSGSMNADPINTNKQFINRQP